MASIEYTDVFPSQLITLRHFLSLEGVLKHSNVHGGLKMGPEPPFRFLMDTLTDSSLAYYNLLLLVSFSKMLKAAMSLKQVRTLVATACHLIYGVCQREAKYSDRAANRTCHCPTGAVSNYEKEEEQDLIY